MENEKKKMIDAHGTAAAASCDWDEHGSIGYQCEKHGSIWCERGGKTNREKKRQWQKKNLG